MNNMVLPKGTKVRVSRIEDWNPDTARKLRDRVGTVISYTYPNSYPIVLFEKNGRRKEFRIAGSRAGQFEEAK